MRLVVIDAHKATYKVFEDRKFLIEVRTTTGELADADQIEEIRNVNPADLQPLESA